MAIIEKLFDNFASMFRIVLLLELPIIAQDLTSLWSISLHPLQKSLLSFMQVHSFSLSFGILYPIQLMYIYYV